MVLEAPIGIYDFEKAKPQNIVINVEISVPCALPPEDDITYVLNYENIVNGIRQIATANHTELLETLAHRMADFCFSCSEDIQDVSVSLEKPDIFEDMHSIGVNIRKSRS